MHKTRPYNQKLHDILIAQGYICYHHVRYDRYELNECIIHFYPSGYFLMLEHNIPVTQKLVDEVSEEILR
jgi:queuine/archaeosine tRNA-ribosyltransferase